MPFPFLPLRVRQRSPLRAALRGFTLIELLVVVMIITILAAIAIPGMSTRLAQRRAKKSAELIATTYRNARLRAMGRGGAVLVRYDAGATPVLSVREAIAGTTTKDGCSTLPASSCVNTDWTSNVFSRQLATFDPTGDGEFTMTIERVGSVAPTFMEVCYTPLGRSYVRVAATAPLVALTDAPRAVVAQADGTGLARNVTIAPNGASRVVAQD